jgi:hypothetical protein
LANKENATQSFSPYATGANAIPIDTQLSRSKDLHSQTSESPDLEEVQVIEPPQMDQRARFRVEIEPDGKIKVIYS